MIKTNILGVNIACLTKADAVQKLQHFLSIDKHHVVITPNPEIVMKATKDRELLAIINQSDLVVPDGIGIVIASKFTKNKVPERVPGIELAVDFFEAAKYLASPLTVYILGSQPGVAEQAKENLENKYQNIKIIGFHSGYFDHQQELIIIKQIQTLEPNLLLVGLGAPKQEKWIWQNKSLPVKISMGVGGSIDVFAGVVNRAPALFIKLNLEWFYRVLKEPKRIFRLRVLPVFVFKVAINRLRN